MSLIRPKIEVSMNSIRPSNIWALLAKWRYSAASETSSLAASAAVVTFSPRGSSSMVASVCRIWRRRVPGLRRAFPDSALSEVWVGISIGSRLVEGANLPESRGTWGITYLNSTLLRRSAQTRVAHRSGASGRTAQAVRQHAGRRCGLREEPPQVGAGATCLINPQQPAWQRPDHPQHGPGGGLAEKVEQPVQPLGLQLDVSGPKSHVQLGMLRRIMYGCREPAESIHQAALMCLAPGPDPSLRHLVDLLHGRVTAGRGSRQKLLVNMGDADLDHLTQARIQRAAQIART